MYKLFFFFISSQGYVSLCFSLMYESESDEKHLDFIAGTPAMVGIGVVRLFCFTILVLC